MAKWEDIYLKDLGHKGSHWLPKEPVEDKCGIIADSWEIGCISEPLTEIHFVTESCRSMVDPDFLVNQNEIIINGVKFRKVTEE